MIRFIVLTAFAYVAAQLGGVTPNASLCLALGVAAIGSMRRKRRPHPMDEIVLSWNENAGMTLSDFLRSAVIFGCAGSGKSSGSGLHLARASLAIPGSGGLICAGKPEDLAFWRTRFAEAGRPDDLVVMDDSGGSRWNFLEWEAKSGDSRSITQFLMTTAETIEGDRSKDGGDNSKFFKKSEERLIYLACEAVRMGMGAVTAPHLHEFISTAPSSPEQMKDEQWRASFHSRCMNAAKARKKLEVEAYDWELVKSFWIDEFPIQDNKVRSSILAGVNNTLFIYNSGVVRQLVSTATTVSPPDLERGKWLLIDMNVPEFGQSGKFVMAGAKFLLQKHILRRAYTPGGPPLIIFADEAQNVVNSFDASFLAECRSHGGCQIFLTQSIHSYFRQIGEHETHAMLGNAYTKIFHLAGDACTEEYASGLLGQELQATVSGSAGDESIGREIFGRNSAKTGYSMDYRPTLQTSAFLSGLRNGGVGNGRLVDGVVIQGGRHRFVTFGQE